MHFNKFKGVKNKRMMHLLNMSVIPWIINSVTIHNKFHGNSLNCFSFFVVNKSVKPVEMFPCCWHQMIVLYYKSFLANLKDFPLSRLKILSLHGCDLDQLDGHDLFRRNSRQSDGCSTRSDQSLNPSDCYVRLAV